MSDRPGPESDPAQAWAREHYGFPDNELRDEPPVAPASVATGSPRAWSRPRTLVAGGVLGLLLVGGAGGATIAAAVEGGGDGGDGGRHGRQDGGRGSR